MRKGVLTVTAAVVILSLVAASQLPLEKPLSSLQRPDPSFPQIGVMPVKQGSNDQSPAFDPNGGVKQTLGDALTIGRKAGLWWEYARDVATVVKRVSENGLQSTTLLVPIDSAIRRLPRKPHQGGEGDSDDDEKHMQSNVERFISAHVVPGTPELPTNGKMATLLRGFDIEIVESKEKKGSWVVQPGDIPVTEVKEASNGRILYMDGVLSPN